MRGLVGYGVLAPPSVFILFCLFGALLATVYRRSGLAIVLVSSVCLFVTATPAFSSYLTECLEAQIPKDTDLGSAQAIVVLGADVNYASGRGSERLGPQSLDRLVMATDAYRQLHLPVAVSGGPVMESRTTLAALMKAALMQYFAVPVTWTEDQSESTYQNALFTAQLLRPAHIGTVILIAQARDLPRAVWSFDRVGLHALPWPAPHTTVTTFCFEDFLPSTTALNQSFYALHELIGGFYYRLQY